MNTLKRILVAEDDVGNLLLAEQALIRLGCEVVAVADGQQAVKWATREHFDMVLLDCHMPVLDGWDTARAIRAHEQKTGAPRVPIIALTGSAMPDEQLHCASAGMDGVLLKPYRLTELARVVEQWAAQP